MPGEKRAGKGVGVPHRELCWVLILRVFIWRSQGRTAVEHSSAFQVCPFRVMVPTDWSVPRQGVVKSMQLVLMSTGPNVSHGITCLVLLLFWA